ncbi:MAG: pyridoxamine 5'-phosphate oxidase family protein [Candidatus Thorarchaeota archaeon]|nr:pyridoxamine 5'-phosphate oxidase family protein [Candidatus Thorarchaeota archaeon]
MSITEKAVTPQNQLPNEALRIVSNGFFAYLATAEENCNPHITTMFYIWDEETGRVFLITGERTRKAKNIKKNDRVSVTIDERDPESPAGNRGVMIRGRARLISVEEMGDVLMNFYLEKYLHFLQEGWALGSRVVIEVTPRIISYWKGIHFHRWENPAFMKRG